MFGWVETGLRPLPPRDAFANRLAVWSILVRGGLRVTHTHSVTQLHAILGIGNAYPLSR
jgi:hypothetical protein